MRQIVLDTETTGLSAEQGDRIIELGCVELVHRRLTGNHLHLYFNPGRNSHEDAIRIHGITNEFLRDKPQFEACADDILHYLDGAELIIHNASFDMGFLEAEFGRIKVKQPPLKGRLAGVIDTLLMARDLFPGKRNSLDALCDRLGVDRSTRTLHGALLDAQLLADVYIHMTRGQESLLSAEGAASSVQRIHTEAVDLHRFDLPVLQADDREAVAHEAVLMELDKASGGKTIWRISTEAVGAVS